MATTDKLTDKQCKAARPDPAKPNGYKLTDGGGMYLLVKPSGSRLWQCGFRLAGRELTASFGAYPQRSLEAARAMRERLHECLARGVDPRTVDLAAEEPAAAPDPAAADRMTLRQVAEAYWDQREDLTQDYRGASERMMKNHLGDLMARDCTAVTRADLMDKLNVLNDAGKYPTVKNVLMWTRNALDWAVQQHERTGLVENVAARINPAKAFGSRETEHFAAIAVHELGDFMLRLDHEGEGASEGDTLAVLGAKLLAYTWVRTKELRHMKEDQFEHWDGVGWVWRVPGKMKSTTEVKDGQKIRVMKKGVDHLVPMSRQAMEVAQELLRRARPGQAYLLPNAWHVLDQPMSENAILYMIYRIGYKGKMTGHGFRSVATTWANEHTDYKADAIDRQLAHTPGKGPEDSQVRAAYNRAKYLTERREMIQQWADFLDSEKAKAAQGTAAPAVPLASKVRVGLRHAALDDVAAKGS